VSDVHGAKRNQSLARAALGYDHGGSGFLPALNQAHDGDRLRREWNAQERCDLRRHRITNLMECRVAFKNAFPEGSGERAHVLINVGQFWHGDSAEENVGFALRAGTTEKISYWELGKPDSDPGWTSGLGPFASETGENLCARHR